MLSHPEYSEPVAKLSGVSQFISHRVRLDILIDLKQVRYGMNIISEVYFVFAFTTTRHSEVKAIEES